MTANKDLLYISIFSFITVLAWIVFDVYHAAVTSTITDVQQQLITPLNPKFEETTLRNIELRQALVAPAIP